MEGQIAINFKDVYMWGGHVHVCARRCLCWYVQVYTCVCKWRSEVNVLCPPPSLSTLYVCMYMRIVCACECVNTGAFLSHCPLYYYDNFLSQDLSLNL